MPPHLIYYVLRGIPFSFRCRKCRRWLFDHVSLRFSLCERCEREIVLSEPGEYHEETASHWASDMQFFDFSSVEMPYHRRVAEAVGNGRVLDVGCGGGSLLSRLQSQHRELFGVDVALGATEIARNRVKEGGFCVADARNLSFKPDTFDYLTCSEVLEHIEGNDVVSECYRVLKPGGVALFTVPNGKGPSGKIPAHIRLFTLESIKDFLEQGGFQVISGQKFGLHIPFVTSLFGGLSRHLGKKLPLYPYWDIEVPELLSVQFLIKCRKPSS